MKLLKLKEEDRLGFNGAAAIKAHPFFAGLDWSNIRVQKAYFIPTPKNREDTDYFNCVEESTAGVQDPQEVMLAMAADDAGNADQEHFGPFEYRNLSLLNEANRDVCRLISSSSPSSTGQRPRHSSLPTSPRPPALSRFQPRFPESAGASQQLVGKINGRQGTVPNPSSPLLEPSLTSASSVAHRRKSLPDALAADSTASAEYIQQSVFFKAI